MVVVGGAGFQESFPALPFLKGPMNKTWKAILINSAKHAVNAILVTAPTLGIAPGSFHFHNAKGIEHILMEMGGAVIAREAAVWVPKLLVWSQTPEPLDTTPVAPQQQGKPQ